MMLPTIHINGTSREELERNYARAAYALLDALKALEDCAPNGRDYYPQGNTAIGQAIKEHAARHAAVMGVFWDVQAIREHLADAD